MQSKDGAEKPPPRALLALLGFVERRVPRWFGYIPWITLMALLLWGGGYLYAKWYLHQLEIEIAGGPEVYAPNIGWKMFRVGRWLLFPYWRSGEMLTQFIPLSVLLDVLWISIVHRSRLAWFEWRMSSIEASSRRAGKPRCGNCGYDLTGLNEPGCPECGRGRR